MAEVTEILPEDFRAHCMALDEPELMGQQLVQQGAVHALTTLLSHGCTEETVREMLDSLQQHAATLGEVAEARGFHRLFAPPTPGVNGGGDGR